MGNQTTQHESLRRLFSFVLEKDFSQKKIILVDHLNLHFYLISKTIQRPWNFAVHLISQRLLIHRFAFVYA